MSYDTKCYELAKAFLADKPILQTDSLIDNLAQTIQDAIEDWIACAEEDWEMSQ